MFKSDSKVCQIASRYKKAAISNKSPKEKDQQCSFIAEKLRNSIVGIWSRGELKESKQIERGVQGNDQGLEKEMNGLERLPVHPVVPVLTTLPLSERLASELCYIYFWLEACSCS
jgi:hypothetical protein